MEKTVDNAEIHKMPRDLRHHLPVPLPRVNVCLQFGQPTANT